MRRVKRHKGKAHSKKPRKKFSIPDDAYVVRCAPGLAPIATQELRYRGITGRKRNPHVLFQRNYDLLFLRSVSSAEGFKMLHIADQVLRCLAFGRYKISKSQLDNIAGFLNTSAQRFRIVVTVEGKQFARQDLKRWLTYELRQRKVSLDDRAEEVLWVFCIDAVFYMGVEQFRAETAPFRNQRKRERKGSLPPPIAAAMAFLSVPQTEETVLDPMCGSGTLLAEVAAYSPDVSLIGVDVDPSAIEVARANLGFARHKQLLTGNATETTLASESVDAMLVNLPFGKQYGDRGHNPTLYKKVLEEMLRLAVPASWRGVVITSDTEALDQALDALPRLAVTRELNLRVLGEPARITCLKCQDSSDS